MATNGWPNGCLFEREEARPFFGSHTAFNILMTHLDPVLCCVRQLHDLRPPLLPVLDLDLPLLGQTAVELCVQVGGKDLPQVHLQLLVGLVGGVVSYKAFFHL